MRIEEANEILRRGIIKTYFEPQLLKANYKKSEIIHPLINEEGYNNNNFLHLYFDIKSGIDYPDGDEWFMIEYLFPYNIALPDNLKGRDYFTTLSLDKGVIFWRHRELIRYKYGKTKRIDDALRFIINKYEELSNLLKDSSVTSGVEEKES